ncbi:hypothetical protein DMZ48_13775 [Robertkochia solimangrovi]|nr:hypothetical protein DMZ48_13775 [Robertkochia solimangrovi]
MIEMEDINASEEMYKILNEIEDMLRRNKISQFMDIARYRASILATQIAIDRRIPRKEDQLETLSAIIPTLTKTVNDVMKPIEECLTDIRKSVSEMITDAHKHNLIDYNEGMNFTEFIHALWRLFCNHPDFKERSLPILDKISQNDALEILAEEVNRRRSVDRAS